MSAFGQLRERRGHGSCRHGGAMVAACRCGQGFCPRSALVETPTLRHAQGRKVGRRGHLFRRNKDLRVNVERASRSAATDPVFDLTRRHPPARRQILSSWHSRISRYAPENRRRLGRRSLDAENAALADMILEVGRASATLKDAALGELAPRVVKPGELDTTVESRSLPRPRGGGLTAGEPAPWAVDLSVHQTCETRRCLARFVSAAPAFRRPTRRGRDAGKRTSGAMTLSSCTTTAKPRAHVRSAAATLR